MRPKSWQQVLAQLKNRGTRDVLTLVFDVGIRKAVRAPPRRVGGTVALGHRRHDGASAGHGANWSSRTLWAAAGAYRVNS